MVGLYLTIHIAANKLQMPFLVMFGHCHCCVIGTVLNFS